MVTAKIDIEKQVEYYMNLPYTMTIKYRSEQGGYYVAGYVELPDLTMTGDTLEEAVKELLSEREDWFETCLKLGVKIPLPVETPKYSGEIRVRMPPSLHQLLAQRAANEGVSLNQYMVTGLARTVGLDEGQKYKIGSK
ncbi:MAG: toxin-antitoxin system HicB family antitoxin [Dehalococcoidales bacterium]|nr:toxin-antitoxin system HicB family antitoxin [Dehalococcoidales bacterium]